MKRMLRKPGEPQAFYVGWMPKADASFRSFIRLLLAVFAVLLYVLASLLISNQNRFSAGRYERDRQTTLTGTLLLKPVPAIHAVYGKDMYGNPVSKTILLVNKGKSGADTVVKRATRHLGNDSTFSATVRGKLIYNHSYVLLELADEETSFEKLKPLPEKERKDLPRYETLDSVVLRGEIIDPKCYLGVMKPGEGKPHSDCAIRCISGGIPPMLRIRSANGSEVLCLLRGMHHESIHAAVLPFVGIPVTVKGRLAQMDDWLILHVDPATGISRLFP